MNNKTVKNAIRTINAKLDEALENEKETEGTEDTVIWHMVGNDYKIAISALEKQIPQKADFEINYGDYESRFACACGKRIVVRHNRGVMDNNDAPNYCSNCGQRLNWGE